MIVMFHIFRGESNDGGNGGGYGGNFSDGNDSVADYDRLQIQYSYMEQHSNVVASCKYLHNNTLTTDEVTLSLKFLEESLIVRNETLREIKYFRDTDQIDKFYSMMIRLSVHGSISNISDCLTGYRF
jgi:hypothetical protein